MARPLPQHLTLSPPPASCRRSLQPPEVFLAVLTSRRRLKVVVVVIVAVAVAVVVMFVVAVLAFFHVPSYSIHFPPLIVCAYRTWTVLFSNMKLPITKPLGLCSARPCRGCPHCHSQSTHVTSCLGKVDRFGQDNSSLASASLSRSSLCIVTLQRERATNAYGLELCSSKHLGGLRRGQPQF